MGDRGHPCLVPFVVTNYLESIAEQYICADGGKYKAMLVEKKKIFTESISYILRFVSFSLVTGWNRWVLLQ